jgi:PHD/YefM family antitoxin component YafN of YafNO toxin-antitoxin module
VAVTARDACKNLIKQVNDDRAAIEITSTNGAAILRSLAGYHAFDNQGTA